MSLNGQVRLHPAMPGSGGDLAKRGCKTVEANGARLRIRQAITRMARLFLLRFSTSLLPCRMSGGSRSPESPRPGRTGLCAARPSRRLRALSPDGKSLAVVSISRSSPASCRPFFLEAA